MTGTPTIFLVDGKGTMTSIWAALLTPEDEDEVLSAAVLAQ